MRLAVITLAATTLAAGAWSEPLAIGQRLVPFTLKDATGKDVDLRSFDGQKAVVLMFIATRCPVSNAYNERMAALAHDYAGKHVAVIGINANREETPEEIVAHARDHGFAFPILKDAGNTQADRFGASVTPEAFVFDGSWTLRYHGRIDDNQRGDNIKSQDLRAALDALVAGGDVVVKETKAFGCTIKRVAR
jgi:peroxiredoxin